eukprot:6884993-Lingulodinium_polyedra.AAC.1
MWVRRDPAGVERKTAQPILDVFNFMFRRTCAARLDIFLVAGEDDIRVERAWSLQRKSVKARRNKSDDFGDNPDGMRSVLTESERKRLSEYIQRWHSTQGHAETYDVGQNPAFRPVRSKAGVMPVITKGAGIHFLIWGPAETLADRWLVPREMLLTQGLPTTEDTVAASCATKCQFSPGVPGPGTRSRRTSVCQAGNGMHLNHIGGVSAAILLATPALGRTTSAATG